MRLARPRILLGLVLCAVLLAASTSGAQTPAFRLAHNGATGSLYDVAAVKFAGLVKAHLEVKVIPASQAGTDEQVIKSIKLGSPEMAVLSTVLESAEPKLAVFELPYLIRNRAHMDKVADSAAVHGALFEGLPKAGMRVLAMWENGFRHITTNTQPIGKPEDLKGMKIRVPSGAWRLKMFKTYGAVPSPLPLKDVHAALKAGTMDGQENPLQQIAGNKLQEVQKYLSLTGHVYSPAFLVVAEESWKKLSKEAQAAVLKAATEVGDYSRAEGERLDKDLVAKLAPPLKLNEADREAFARASSGLYDEFGKQVPGGNELLAQIRGLK